jgi:hypothetical protein
MQVIDETSEMNSEVTLEGRGEGGGDRERRYPGRGLTHSGGRNVIAGSQGPGSPSIDILHPGFAMGRSEMNVRNQQASIRA